MKKIAFIVATLVLLAALTGITSATTSVQSLKQKDETAKIKYQQARDQYQKELNFYKSAKQDLIKARSAYQKTKNENNKEAFEKKAGTFLEAAINSLMKRLESMKKWVVNKRSLPEDERQAIIAEIDQDISWLNGQLSGIENAAPAEIKEKASAIRQYWNTHRFTVKRVIGQIWAARLRFVIEKAEGISFTVSEKINELKAAGNDTSQLELWLADFNGKIVLAKEKYEAAKIKFQAVSSISNGEQLFKDGHQLIKDANQYVIQAHNQLKNIIREMKKMGKNVETSPNDGTSAAEQQQ